MEFPPGNVPAAALAQLSVPGIGVWVAAYVALSLSLALIWIASVAVIRLYQRHQGPPDIWDLDHRPRLPLGFRYWQHDDEAFVETLRALEKELSSETAVETKKKPPLTTPQ